MNIYQMAQYVKQNPSVLAKQFNIPQGVNMQDPYAIMQYLMNNGKASQDRYNWANQQAKQMQKNNNMM